MVREGRRQRHHHDLVGGIAVSVQILDLAIYSTGGERRLLSFRPGRVNIITGDSKTGKSALVSIVDYCFGSRECGVPDGVITDTVAWYALRLTDGTAQHVIARRAPTSGRRTNSEAYYAIGEELELPDGNALAATTNIDSLVTRLSAVIGIGLNLHEPPEGQTRAPLAANLRHALAFVFQTQNEIAHRDLLFHGQSDSHYARAIADALPYFLGAVGDDFVARKATLRRQRQELRRQERELERLELLTGDGLGRAASFVAEARAVGLIAPEATPETHDEAIALLRESAAEAPEEQLARGESRTDQAELERLNGVQTALRRQLDRETHELEAIRAMIADEKGFVREAAEQVSRLSSINLFEAQEEPCCPLCDRPTAEEMPSVQDVRDELERATARLAPVARHTPGLEQLAVEQEGKIADTRARMKEVRESLEAVGQADARYLALREASTRRAHALGRISVFLESIPDVSDDSALRADIARRQHEIEELEAELTDEATQTRLESISSNLTVRLTEWAEFLDLENSGSPFRLDLRRLKIVADTLAGPRPMNLMGSGANWVGCHLIAYLALHHWFVKNDRPVPRFLFLDQPSQVYFPAENPEEGDVGKLDDEDRRAVTRLFELIRDVVAGLDGELQVIITEHAEPDEAWYREAVIERWRGGKALVPSDWQSGSP